MNSTEACHSEALLLDLLNSARIVHGVKRDALGNAVGWSSAATAAAATLELRSGDAN